MKKSLFALLALFVLGSLVLAACGGGGSTSTRPNPPADYANKANPFKGNADAAAKGKTEFTNLCVSCHGEKGLGDGPAGKALKPPAANLQKTASETSDAYLFWRIADGGSMAPFNSSMPAHKATMSEEKMWQIVTYIQTLK